MWQDCYNEHMSTHAEVATRRSLIVSLLAADPGIEQGELADMAKVPPVTLQRDLRALHAAGELARIAGGVYCLPKDVPRARTYPPLSPVARREAILTWVGEDRIAPSQRELAAAFGVSLPVIQNDTRMLLAGGALIRRARYGRDLGPGHAVWKDPARHRVTSNRARG